jgi:GTP-binding protein
LWTLFHFKFKRHFKAGHGEHGSKSRSSGAQGEDVIVKVPLGTLIRDKNSNEVLHEIVDDQEEFLAVEGGMGGRGNWHFKSSTNQTPRYAQPGKEGSEQALVLELKILADVGLVGFPNAGKSTLLSVVTSAKPKIGDYEFTTLKPNLGIVEYRDYRSFVMADIPGIIEGASEGKGLGHRFLRHIERNSILLYLIAADAEDIRKEFEVLRNELIQYNPELVDKEYLVAISKSDLLDEELHAELDKELISTMEGIPYLFISSVSQSGLRELKDMLWKKLNE